jgi:cytidine deaminase
MSAPIARESELTARARAAQGRAYAPYSKFQAGAALLCADGTIVEGCNVENASYPAGNCAERVALGAAVAQGHRKFVALSIATDAPEGTPPCGICRQALAEFAPRLAVIAVARDGGPTRWTLDALLPHPFTPTSLQV